MKNLFSRKKCKRLLAFVLATDLCLTGLYIPGIGSANAAEPSEVNLALNKRVYCSSEEGTSAQGVDTHAVNAVDGDRGTWWVAKTKDSSLAWDAKYPEWLCVDLGTECNIDSIDLEFESKAGARTYDYKIYSSVDTAPTEETSTVPSGYTEILDKSGNTESGVQTKATFTGETARYILVEIISCNQYDPGQKWQAASIYELAVYGTQVVNVSNLSLNKTVYCSSEEGTSSQGVDTHAVNAVDGDRGTWWVAKTKDSSLAWDAKYPEWLCVDLGAECNISSIDLEFESKAGARTYGYKIYSSVDTAPTEGTSTVPSGYTEILDKSGNTESGVQTTATFTNKTARYILVEIVSCNQYNPAEKWQAASIYELTVNGTYVNNNDPSNGAILQTASGRDDSYAVELDGEWLFGGKTLASDQAILADHSSWKKVTIPHTWNNKDAEDGGNNYERTAYWYHKDFTLDANYTGKRVYIEFLGSNTKTDLYVNGMKVGATHKGGYTTFRYDITDQINIGSNVIDVRVDNTLDQEIAPISGDFNMYGGIYRRVYLVAVDDVHVDLENNGSSGLFLTTGNMRSMTKPADLGQFNIKADLVNDSNAAKTVTVVATVTGDNAPAPITKSITIPANSKVTFSENCVVNNPTLWEGIDYSKGADNTNVGYQYTVSLEIKDGATVIDKVEDKLGFRYFWIDSSNNGEDGEGFFLNGEKYSLRGVNRHSYQAGVGSAMTEQQHKADMETMLELGVNTVRLCHYPQTDYFYDLCDENGIIVWTEIPLVNAIGSADGFFDVTKAQLVELIRQQYNRPCVVFWGLENEIGQGTSLTNATNNIYLSKMKELVHSLDALAKAEDTTGRYTTQAVNRDYAMDQNVPNSVNTNFENNVGWKSDLISWNIYPGWYPDANFFGTFEEVMQRKTAQDSRPFCISEYGWGGNVNQHEAYPELGKRNLSAGGSWHPEEYQNLMNEEAISYINAHDEIWATYYWVMFDFAVDSRFEGSQAALNDKGLVTADRKVKKDSYYLYKANWNKNDSFTYITSRRWTNRTAGETYIKVYSNCDNVELFVNDVSLGKMTSKGNGVFMMENVDLAVGTANIKTVGTYEGNVTDTYVDTCAWSATAAQVPNDSENIALNKTVYCSSEEGTATDGASTVVENIVDGDLDTRWTAFIKNGVNGAEDAMYPEWVCVDLGAEYEISKIDLKFESKANRTYDYKIYTSLDAVPKEARGAIPAGYTQILDKTGNTESGVQSTLSFSGKTARYILVEVTSCSLYSSSTKYVAASIYEMAVYGELVNSSNNPGGTGNTDDTKNPGGSDNQSDSANVDGLAQTGDTNHIPFLIILMIGAAWALASQKKKTINN